MNREHDDNVDLPLGSLSREIDAPHSLEDRTVRALQGAGLIASSRRRPMAWQIAAALLLFAGGMAVGRVSASATTASQDPAQPRYVLLLHDGPVGLSAEQEAAVVAEYRDWAVGLRRAGRFVTGERLSEAVAVVPPAVVSDAAGVRGYFVISAADLDDAKAVAAACPHARRGGHIVVRPIEPT